MNARAIGLMTMLDGGKRDHKIVAVCPDDPVYAVYAEASDLPSPWLNMLRRFFQDYKAWKANRWKSMIFSRPRRRFP